jgi:hypothetical protein
MFMPKKIFFILLCSLLTLEIRNLKFSPVFATDPIIIDQSILGPPPGTGKDYNYHSNDILNTDTVKCSGTFSISNSFDPILSGTDSRGQPIYQTQSINQISGTLNLDENYTNRDPSTAETHLRGYQTKISGDDSTLSQAFLSLSTTNPYGASGMADRSTPYRVLQCQKSQRLIYAVESLNPDANLVYDNEQIGWNCSGQIYSVLEKKGGASCTPIRLADIAAALASDAIFYDTSVNCSSPSLPDPVALPVTIPHPNPLSHDVAQKLFNTAVPVVADGSIASSVTVCDKDASGNPVNCQIKKQSIPRGAVLATNQKTVSQIIPSTQSVPSYNVCNTTSRANSADKPNPLSFFAKVVKLFGEVTDTAKTFTDSTTKTFNVDSRVNIDQDQAFLNNLLPASDQSKYQTTDQTGSSTDGKVIHPGNPVARSVFANDLLPANF